jgi:hypothetical protein
MEPYALSDDYLNWLRNSQRSWEEVLHYPTVEESIQLMVDLLGPAAVDFGLRKTAYAKYLPPGVAGAASHIVDEPRTPTQLKELPALVPTQKVHTYAPQEQYGNQAQQPQGYTPQGYAAPAPQGYAAPSPQGYSAPAPQPPPAPSRQPNYQANQGFVAPQGYTQPAVAPQEYAQPRQTAPLGHAQPAAAPQAYAQPAPQGYAQPAPQAYAQPRQAVHQPPAVPFQEQLPHMGEPLQQTAHNSRPSALPNVEDLEEYPEEESGSMQINIDGQERTIQKPVGANAIQERIARVASLKNNK